MRYSVLLEVIITSDDAQKAQIRALDILENGLSITPHGEEEKAQLYAEDGSVICLDDLSPVEVLEHKIVMKD